MLMFWKSSKRVETHSMTMEKKINEEKWAEYALSLFKKRTFKNSGFASNCAFHSWALDEALSWLPPSFFLQLHKNPLSWKSVCLSIYTIISFLLFQKDLKQF